MDLETFLNEQGMTPKELAEQIKTSFATIYRILRNERRPSIGTCSKINKFSSGKVTINELRGSNGNKRRKVRKKSDNSK